ncbi:hypothetical protein [Legionella jordanis]|uniref:DUF883 domain-containing protein n=1 Tax=Legionella jordanis TaxID=456 RepID=A0A0W0V7F4_9GAMM|nr:hypothetical protein [Legionella jordanis]KTD16055.1 hypothetical protein Ljor_0361 [Legionella jordanis]VEH12486.1 Uncharacterised protein [Legionella jordanis]
MDMKKPETSNRPQVSSDFSKKGSMRESGLGDATNTLINDSKRVANELYQEGKSRVNEAQSNIKEYSDQVAQKVYQRPLMSLLIAGGVGFILSALLRR